MNKLKQYLFNKVRDTILYFLDSYSYEFYYKGLQRLDKIQEEQSKKINDNWKYISTLFEQNILNKENIKDLFKTVNKISKDSVTMWLDISCWKEDGTSIIILSRIKWEERVEFINRRFSNIWEVEKFIKSIKKDDDNVYIDKAFHYPPINF